MKTIGIVGGITWHSTLDYYRLLNEEVNKRLGGYHAAKIILNSVDFAEVKVMTEREDWEGITFLISQAAKIVESAGAGCIMLGANTMHKVATEVQAAINIPLIHIADAVAGAIKDKKLKTVALLGTKYTMQLDFYKEKLAGYGIQTIIPGEEDIEFINHTIYSEFSKGIFLPATKQAYLHIIDKLIEQGAEGIILGCTEIPILIKQENCSVPVFDTAYIHSMAAVDFVLQD
jgi:aspartate racemase